METKNYMKNHLFFNIKPVNIKAKRQTLKEKTFDLIKIVSVGKLVKPFLFQK